MNQLKNGTLLVVIATFVTAVLILVTGREDAKPSASEHEVVAIEKQETETEVEELAKVIVEPKLENNTVENLTTDVVNKAMSSTTESVEIIAPEGPFKKLDVSEEAKQEADQRITASKDSEANEESLESEAITAEGASSQHEVLNHITQPIWMDQKLGDFKSVATGDVVFKIMPTSSDGLQGENPNKVVTSKSDKFGTNTISADYNYQQMPMYNGGYYIAPMPSYLMPSMLPANVDNGK